MGLRRFIRRRRDLERDERGHVAVEFAMVAGPFLLMMFAVVEIAFMFYVGTALENATSEAARMIRTGQLQFAGASAKEFEDMVCKDISILVSCEERLHVDVRVFEDFDDVSMTSPVIDGKFDPAGFGVDFGGAGDIVLVRVFYLWDVIVPDLGTGLANLPGGQRLFVSSATFRNEPFGDVS